MEKGVVMLGPEGLRLVSTLECGCGTKSHCKSYVVLAMNTLVLVLMRITGIN